MTHASSPDAPPPALQDAPFRGSEAESAARAAGRRGGDDPSQVDLVLLGPPGSGKTSLLKALRHPADTAHSYAGRFSIEALDAAARGAERAEGPEEVAEAAELGPKGLGRRLLGRFGAPKAPPLTPAPRTPERRYAADVRRGPDDASGEYARQLHDEDVATGFDCAPTLAPLTPIPLTLVVREQLGDRGRLAPAAEYSITAVDTAGALFAETAEERSGAARERFEIEQAALAERLARADGVVICLPADAPELHPSRRRAMQTGLAHLRTLWASAAAADPTRRFRAVVALTKFERLLAPYGRRGFVTANDRAQAGALSEAALRERWGWLTPRLRELAEPEHTLLRVQPVSTFGFIPGDGGANVDPESGLLRTRPHAEGASADLRAPYTFEAVFGHYWRPFLTLDPFVQAATGLEGALSFALFGDAEPAP